MEAIAATPSARDLRNTVNSRSARDGTALAMLSAMSASSFVSPPRHSIAHTERGWVLVIQDDHCSVVQVFDTAASARRAVDRMLEFFHTISAPPPSSRHAA
jgi:hypothetical protein